MSLGEKLENTQDIPYFHFAFARSSNKHDQSNASPRYVLVSYMISEGHYCALRFNNASARLIFGCKHTMQNIGGGEIFFAV
jgi:hypothetical protein